MLRQKLLSSSVNYCTKALQIEFISRKNANYASEHFYSSDHASTGFQLKIKEVFHIQRQQPPLNQQLHHVNLKLSF